MEFELCSAVLFIMIVAVAVFRQNARTQILRHSGAMAAAIMAAQWTELLAMHTMSAGRVSERAEEIICFLMLAAQLAVPLFFGSYFVRRHRHENHRAVLFRLLNVIPYLLCVGLLFWSIWSHYVFYTDARGFCVGKLFLIVPLCYLLYAAGTVVYAVRHPKRRRTSLAHCGILLLLGAVPEFMLWILPAKPLYCLCTTMMIFLVYSNEEVSSREVDEVTGAYRRSALMQDVETAKENGEEGHIYALALDNFKFINEAHGVEGGNVLMRQLVRMLQTEFSREMIYRYGGDIFVIFIQGSAEKSKTLDTIRQVFARRYRVGNEMVHVTACISIIHLEQYSAGDFALALEFAVAKAKASGKAALFEMGENNNDSMKRRKAIEQTMFEHIQQGRFEVHYQPIWDIGQQKFHSMEALARLNVPGYGYVSPEEFIRIAEKNGTILRIGMLVLEEVCRFIKAAKLEEHGIEFVEVNLSVVQCTEDQICSSVCEVLRRYDVPPRMINLEVTESAAAYSEKKLIQNLARMTLKGLTFSLDDYGSGYSNINYLVSLPFTIVKIDKYLVWNAAKSAMSRQILEHTIAMFKAIHLRVVTEGIEDPEMAQMVTEMGADYIQGYYFSKPVSGDQVLERLTGSYPDQFRSK